MNEIWKDIEGWEGLYQVSNMGRVKSLPRVLMDSKGRRHPVGEKILKPHDRKGYDSVTLQDMRRETYSVHRLVALHFIPNPDNLPIVNHKDENPKNNRADNLEFCTISYNTRYGTGIQRQVANTTYPVKSVEQISIDGHHIAYFDSITEASKATGANKSVIVRCCKGKMATAGGYRWKYNN